MQLTFLQLFSGRVPQATASKLTISLTHESDSPFVSEATKEPTIAELIATFEDRSSVLDALINSVHEVGFHSVVVSYLQRSTQSLVERDYSPSIE